MNLEQWAIDWQVPYAALVDLRLRMGLDFAEPPPDADEASGSEARASSQVRLEAPQKGCRLWRNNRGAGRLENGSFVRWGLANQSEQVGKMLRSADLIGIDSRPIPPEAVGRPWGRFVSREIKAPGWRFNPNDEHEVGQLNWANLIVSLGGDAGFATGPGTL